MTTMETAPGVALWDRQTGESSKAFAAFTVYRNLGPTRSVAKVSQILPETGKQSVSLRWLEEWSSRYAWRRRAMAWDDFVEAAAQRAELDAIVEMRRRHARNAQKIQEKALEKLEGLDLDEMSARDVLRYLVQGSQMERLSLGEPTEIVNETATIHHEAEQDLVVALLRDPTTAAAARKIAEKVAELAPTDAGWEKPEEDSDG